jgi:hypothetical protein
MSKESSPGCAARTKAMLRKRKREHIRRLDIHTSFFGVDWMRKTSILN